MIELVGIRKTFSTTVNKYNTNLTMITKTYPGKQIIIRPIKQINLEITKVNSETFYYKNSFKIEKSKARFFPGIIRLTLCFLQENHFAYDKILINDLLKLLNLSAWKHVSNNNSKFLITCIWWATDFSKSSVKRFCFHILKVNIDYCIRKIVFCIFFFTQKNNLSFHVKQKLVILRNYIKDKKKNKAFFGKGKKIKPLFEKNIYI